MALQETVTIRNESGASAQGAADEVVRYSDTFRKATGTLYIVGGFLFGGACLVAIGPHIFITTWLFPLLGIWLGMRTFKRKTIVFEFKGTCPSCKKPIEIHGGSIDDPGWQKCPECESKLVFEVQPSPAV